MATRIHRMVTEQLTVITLSGVVRGDDIIRVLDRLTGSAETPIWVRQLWVCSGIFELDVDWPELRRIKLRIEALLNEQAMHGGRWAIVAPRETVYQFSRALHAVIRSPAPERQVFRTLGEARAWLGAHPSPAPRG